MKQFIFNKSIDSTNLTFVKVFLSFTLQMVHDGYRELSPISESKWWISYLELIPGVLYIVYPFLVILILISFRERLNERKMKDKIESLYSDINLKRNVWTIYYYPIWIFRRILFIYIPIIFAPNVPVIQIQLIVMTTLFYLMNYFGNRPHTSRNRFYLEAFNEYLGLFFIIH